MSKKGFSFVFPKIRFVRVFISKRSRSLYRKKEEEVEKRREESRKRDKKKERRS